MNLLFPFADADHQTPDSAATVTITVYNNMTIFEPSILAENLTLNVTADAMLRKGAILIVKIKTTATETTTFGTGIDAPVITGVAGKTKTQTFVFDGTAFIATGASVQID